MFNLIYAHILIQFYYPWSKFWCKKKYIYLYSFLRLYKLSNFRAVQKNKQTNDRGKHPDKPKEEKTVKQDSHYDKSADNKSSSPKHTSDDEYDADTDVDEDDVR